MKKNEAIKAYKQACTNVVKAFIRKQKIKKEYWWVNDEIGGVVCFSDTFYISFSNILYDLTEKRKKGFIFKWYEDFIKLSKKGVKGAIAEYDEYCIMQDFSEGKFKEGKRFSNMEELKKYLTK
jgi:hypothetical protein